MNGPAHPDETPKRPRSALDGLDPRRLMAEGLGLDAGEEGIGEAPEVPGFEILRLLGSGGMGRVWLARQTSLDRLVAVKVLHAGGDAASQWLDRLEREARSMARISHPHIVAVYDFVRLDEGGAAIVMEWVASGTLREKWLAHGKPVRDLAAVLTVMRQIASSLAAAHAAGIVHRDLKPENVLVAVDGSVKVTDFGLALPLGPESQRLTLTGTSMGTLGYMAPEQIEGREVDARADVYSLGVILCELLTGIRPQGNFDAPGKVRRHLPTGLERLVLDSLRTRPQKRIASAKEFLSRLDRCGRSRMPLVVAASVALAGIGIAAIVLSGNTDMGVETAPPASSAPAIPAPATPTTLTALPPALSLPADWENRAVVKSLRGEWQIGSEGFRSDASIAVLQILGAAPPQGARVRISFTRLEGMHSVALFFRTPRGVGSAEVSAWETNLAGIQIVGGKDLRLIPDPPVMPIENGRRYEMVVEIRAEQVSLSIDGQLVHEVSIANTDLGVTFPWEWETLENVSTWLAIGSFESPTLFHSVAVEAL